MESKKLEDKVNELTLWVKIMANTLVFFVAYTVFKGC